RSFKDDRVRRRKVVFEFVCQARIEQLWMICLFRRKTALDVAKSRRLHQLLEVTLGEDRQVLVPAEDEVVQPAADALAIVRPIAEPSRVPLDELSDRAVAVRSANAVYAASFETTIGFSEMPFQVRQMFNDMVRVKRLDGFIAKRQAAGKVRPHVAFARKH